MSTGNKLGTCMISLYFWCFSNLQDRWHYHCEADRSICQRATSLELVRFCSTFDASQIYQSCNASKGHSFLSLCYQFKSRSDYSLNLFISMFVVKSIYRGFCLDLLATQPSWNWNEWILVICYLFTLFNQWASYYLFNPRWHFREHVLFKRRSFWWWYKQRFPFLAYRILFSFTKFSYLS